MNTQYDAIEYAQQLEALGVPKAQADLQAKTLAQVVSHCAASPADLQNVTNELGHKIEEVKSGLEHKIEEVKSELEHKIEAVKNELEHKIEAVKNELEHKIEGVKNELEHKIELVKNELERKIDLVNTSMTERFRAQNRMNALIVALLVGLYVQAYFR